jgi:indole-3-glycerol phosphate synthase
VSTILETIVEQKKSELKLLRAQHSHFERRSEPRRPFCQSLRLQSQLAVIAEVKKASPSRGVLCQNFDPAAIATSYYEGGAQAISVLTDERFFQGKNEYLQRVRAAVPLPVLRKEFIIDTLQIEQSASINADAILLIAAILSDNQLQELYAAAAELELDVLIEVHTAHELERAMRVEPPLLGINNRDLATFATSLATTVELMRLVPHNVAVVSESGIFSSDDATTVYRAGACAVLVGESLMRHPDPAVLIKELHGACAH